WLRERHAATSRAHLGWRHTLRRFGRFVQTDWILVRTHFDLTGEKQGARHSAHEFWRSHSALGELFHGSGHDSEHVEHAFFLRRQPITGYRGLGAHLERSVAQAGEPGLAARVGEMIGE